MSNFHSWRFGILFTSALFVAACSSESSSQNARSRCIEGETKACTCTDGNAGAQSCTSSGIYGACECTGPIDDDPVGSPDMATASSPEKRIFVTKLTYSATAARSACQNAADAAELGGTWMPWLSANRSTGDDNAITDIPKTGRWSRIDGQVAFKNRGQFGTTPLVPLNITEDGSMLDEKEGAWTGTQRGGTASDYTCQGWTENDSFFSGTVGLVSSTDNWTDSNYVNCSYKLHVYCIEK